MLQVRLLLSTAAAPALVRAHRPRTRCGVSAAPALRVWSNGDAVLMRVFLSSGRDGTLVPVLVLDSLTARTRWEADPVLVPAQGTGLTAGHRAGKTVGRARSTQGMTTQQTRTPVPCQFPGPPVDVVEWRACRLREAGFRPALADALARNASTCMRCSSSSTPGAPRTWPRASSPRQTTPGTLVTAVSGDEQSPQG